MFTRADIAWLSTAVRRFYTAQSPEALAQAGVAEIRRRFSAMGAACEQISYDGSRYRALQVEMDVPPPPDYVAYIHDHPIFPLMRPRPQAVTIQLREITSLSAWQRTEHFNGVARRIGFTDQLITTALAPDEFFSLSAYRDAPFSPEEHQLLTQMQRHLHAAWHRVRKLDPRGHPGASSLRVSADYRLPGLAPAQERVLAAYFSGWRNRREVPRAMRAWLAAVQEGLRATPVVPPRVLLMEEARGRLYLRYFPPPAESTSRDLRVLFVEEPARPDFLALTAFGLTARQCEVLHWIAQGKRDGEIAQILGCAVGTVAKHVEHIMARLGAGHRAAAVSLAYAWLERGPVAAG